MPTSGGFHGGQIQLTRPLHGGKKRVRSKVKAQRRARRSGRR